MPKIYSFLPRQTVFDTQRPIPHPGIRIHRLPPQRSRSSSQICLHLLPIQIRIIPFHDPRLCQYLEEKFLNLFDTIQPDSPRKTAILEQCVLYSCHVPIYSMLYRCKLVLKQCARQRLLKVPLHFYVSFIINHNFINKPIHNFFR